MNEIKVTVTYDKPLTSRIDNLFAEYEAAHNLTEATKAELTPIIDAVGEAKHRAILEQLEPIKEAVKKLHLLRKQVYSSVTKTHVCVTYTLNGKDKRDFVVRCSDWNFNGECDVYFSVTNLDSMIGFNFEKIDRQYEWNYFGAKDGVITNWNKLNIIEGLQKSLERQIKDLIRVANDKRNTIQENLNALLSD